MSKIKILPIVVACLISGSEILLLKRNKDPFINQWSLPGGKIDAGEFTDQSVKREIMEETGIIIHSLNYKGLVSELIYHEMNTDDLLYHHLVHVFSALVEKSNNRSSSSEGELAWFGLDQIEAELKSKMVITDLFIIKEMLIKDRPGLYNSLVDLSNEHYVCKEFSLISSLK